MARDMTEIQFVNACSRRNFKPQGFMGYYNIGGGRCVSVDNAGPRLRDRLAYLIRMESEWLQKQDASPPPA